MEVCARHSNILLIDWVSLQGELNYHFVSSISVVNWFSFSSPHLNIQRSKKQKNTKWVKSVIHLQNHTCI